MTAEQVFGLDNVDSCQDTNAISANLVATPTTANICWDAPNLMIRFGGEKWLDLHSLIKHGRYWLGRFLYVYDSTLISYRRLDSLKWVYVLLGTL